MKNINLLKRIFFIGVTLVFLMPVRAQITGKFGTYYDQQESQFETLPTSTSDIIFLGNSITDGGEWAELFQNPRCKNRGISGDIIPGVLNRLETITKGQPSKIFLLIGTNDINWGFTNDSIVKGVRTIVQRIKNESPRTKIIVQSILPVNDCYSRFEGHTKRYTDVAVINGMLKTMTEEEGVDYLDLYSRFANEEGKLNPIYSNDGLHLNGEGYLLWKDIIEEYYGVFPQPTFKRKISVCLLFGTGSNIIDSRDLGASPLDYLGFGGHIMPGAFVEWKRYHIELENRVLYNASLSSGGNLAYALGLDSRVEFLYRCNDGQLRLWAGGTLQNYLDIKYNQQLMNAALGYTYFLNLHGTGMAQYDFAPIFDGTHNLFSVYGKLSLPLVGLANRPGFPYIDNATAQLYFSEETTSERQTKIFPFPGISTDIGFVVNLPNLNKIGLSYRWDYLTTRHTGTYRFDHANHIFNISYLFHVN